MMGSESQLPSCQDLHFVLFPFMAQGHMIPMVDIGKLLARRGAVVTVVTTPVNASRFRPSLSRAKDSGLNIRVVELQFPCAEVGLSQGCENLDMVTDMKEDGMKFFVACSMLETQAEALFKELSPPPSGIISDMCFPYTMDIANKFSVPRITFHGFSCFGLLCVRSAHANLPFLESIGSETEYFVMPGLPDEILFTRAQLPMSTNSSEAKEERELFERIAAADLASVGAIVNSFQELEPAYVEAYKRARGGGEVWCIGPVSLCNEDGLDKEHRGNNSSALTDEILQGLMDWLDSQDSGSVLYVCLGSLCNLVPEQLKELGLGLEASGKPFVWAVRGNENMKQLDKWMEEDKFEERIKNGRGFLIRGWAPQVLILSHPAIGGFLTHCGWNSTLEGITEGLPLITWPLFADQFSNEKLVVEVLRIGVKVGVEVPMKFGEEEEIGVLIRSEGVRKAVVELMDGGEEGERRRERVRELGKLGKGAVVEVEQGTTTTTTGSSYNNLTKLIEHIRQLQLVQARKSK